VISTGAVPTMYGRGMSRHHATIRWANGETDFLGGHYGRAHTWSFDGGLTVPGSSSPSVVPVPLSDPAAVDPEEAFVAALSSCHMLTFLHLAHLAGFAVQRYEDAAVGDMAKNERGVPFVKVVTLNPRVTYGGDKRPSTAELAKLHHDAHERCFIAQSVKTELVVNDPGPTG
jgi:organic hydroperoxide reductase OsmC/OhrA